MAREGFRTLVVAKKVLTEDQYQDFEVCTNVSQKFKFPGARFLEISRNCWARSNIPKE